MGLSLALFGLLGAVFLGQAIVDADYKKLVISVAFGLVLALSLMILRNWRLGIITFFVWILFEDFCRKWFGNNLLFYATKDILIGITYLSYFSYSWKLRRERKDHFRNPLGVPLLLMFAWACVELVNPGITDILVPILGLRMTFLYVPMIYLGYSFFRHERDVSRFFILLISFALPISSLGIAQSVLGSQLLNPQSAPNFDLSSVRAVPGSSFTVTRATSVFVDPGRYAMYLFAMVYLGLGLLGYLLETRPKPSAKLRLWVVLCWSLVLVGLFVCGQRAAIVWLILSVPLIGFGYWYAKHWGRSSRRSSQLIQAALVCAVGLYLASVFFPLAFRSASALYQATINPTSQYSELTTRPVSYWADIKRALESNALIGHGTGTNSLGLQYVASYEAEQRMPGNYHVEAGFAAVIWEWGVVGLCLWLWWSVLLVVKLIQKVMTLRFTRYYWLGVSIALFAFFLLFPWFYMGMQVYQQYVTQAFLWFMVGLVFRLPGDSAAAGRLLAPGRLQSLAATVPGIATII
jgi:hypothetical protein